MRNTESLCLRGVVAIAALCLIQGTSIGQTLELLGTLPDGRVHSRAYDVNTDGSVVVGKSWDGHPSINPARSEAFRWTRQTGMVGLGVGADTEWMTIWPVAVSSDGGTVVGGERYYFESNGIGYSGARTWLWDESQGQQSLHIDDIDFSSSTSESTWDWASDVAPDGAVIAGHASRNNSYHLSVYRLFPDGSHEFIFEPGEHGLIQTDFSVISDDGRTVAGRGRTADGYAGFIWRDGELLFLRHARYVEIFHISNDGSVVVGVESLEDGSDNHFVWREGEGVTLYNTVPGTDFPVSRIKLINGTGDLLILERATNPEGEMYIVGEVGPARPFFGFVRDTHGIDLEGGYYSWSLWATSDDGRVFVGNHTYPDGRREAFRLEIPWICPGDVSEDGEVNEADIVPFIDAFLQGMPRADLNQDSFLDMGDISQFIQHLEHGC